MSRPRCLHASMLSAFVLVLCSACGSSTFVVADPGPDDSGDASVASDSGSETPSDSGTIADAPSSDTRPDAACKGTHPIVDGGARFCGPADCYCSDKDACYPKEIAAACCAVPVKCG